MVEIAEKKKLLLVAVSVGVFLVIVMGASILVFTPRGSSPAAAANPVKPIPAGNPANTGGFNLPGVADAVDTVKNSIDIQGPQTPPKNNPQGNVFYIYGENPGETITVDRTTTGTGNRLIVDVPRPATVTVPDAPALQPTPKPAAAPARKTPAPAPKAAAPKAAAAKTPDNFWVQTGSFSTVARAETAKDTLASKGITSLIANGNVEGKTVFRVRVGPYTSQKEADYWRELIKSINGFEESQVWASPAR